MWITWCFLFIPECYTIGKMLTVTKQQELGWSLTASPVSSWFQWLHILCKQRTKAPAVCGIPLWRTGGIDAVVVWCCRFPGGREYGWEKSRSPVPPLGGGCIFFPLLFLILFSIFPLASTAATADVDLVQLVLSAAAGQQTGPSMEVAGPRSHMSTLEISFFLGLFLAGAETS